MSFFNVYATIHRSSPCFDLLNLMSSCFVNILSVWNEIDSSDHKYAFCSKGFPQ